MNTATATKIAEAQTRFDEILAEARKHGNEAATGYLANWVKSLEEKLKLAKQETESAVLRLYEYVEQQEG